MKVLIASFMTPQASHRYNFFPKVIGNFSYFVASDLCENFPFDLNIAALKNKCIKAARMTKPDWLVLLSGIDASIQKLPDFRSLNENILYLGKKIDLAGVPEGCSHWILSKKIYMNHSLDEELTCYGWDDFDFVHNECRNIEKQSIDNLLAIDLPPEDPPLVSRFSYCQDVFNENRERFLKKYKKLHGHDFVF
jgi:hypothetical protein